MTAKGKLEVVICTAAPLKESWSWYPWHGRSHYALELHKASLELYTLGAQFYPMDALPHIIHLGGVHFISIDLMTSKMQNGRVLLSRTCMPLKI